MSLLNDTVYRLENGETGRKREALAVQVSTQQVERRSLDIYELLAGGGVR